MREILYFLELETKVANSARLKPSFPNFTRGLVSAILLLLFFGCGGESGEKESSSEIQIPIKVDIDMPKMITIGDDELREHLGDQEKTRNERFSDESNYKDIKPITWRIEKLFDETKFNICIVNSVMAKIEKRCKATPVNKICKIPKDSIEFLFDQKIVDKLIGYVSRDKISDIETEHLIGERLKFGAVEFIRHDENSTYTYSLMMDNSDIENMFFATKESKSYIRTIKWSKKSSKVFYSSLADRDRTTLYYQNIPNSAESVHLTFFSLNKSPFISNTHIFDLSRDNNSTDFLLKMNILDIDETNAIPDLYRKYSYLQISKDRGYFVSDFLNIFANITYKDNKAVSMKMGIVSEMYQQIFDMQGRIEATKYCPQSTDNFKYDFHSECNYDDKATWITSSDDKLIFEPFDKLFFRDLDHYDGNITDGEYFLLPPEQNVTNLTVEDVLKHSVGSFILLEGSDISYGFFYNKDYAARWGEGVYDKMNALQLVRAKYNDLNLSLEKRVEEFELIEGDKRPVVL